MKIYIWEYVCGVTEREHDGGGLIITTSRNPQKVWDESEDFVELKLPSADFVYTIDSLCEEKVIVFPDSGCC